MSAEGPYRLVCVPHDLAILREWGRRAAALGAAEQFRDALQMAHDKLTGEPHAWGDPLYRLHELDLPVYRGMTPVFYALYAVDDERRLVYLTQCWLRPGHPLDRTP